MKPHNIEFTQSPLEADIAFLTHKIMEPSQKYGICKSFAFFIRGGEGKILAGCNGFLFFGNIYTDQLWVDPDHRCKGWGRALMEKVFSHGRAHQCTMATVNTMSFQNARHFYEKLGYTVDFEREGYVQSSSFLCLKKDL